MIYLDNAATTDYKPREVIDAVTSALTEYPYNPNRGGGKSAVELQRKLLEARRKISVLVNNDSEQHVAFTSGCTAALNLAIMGTARRGHIIITSTEHNSVLRPVMQLRRKGYAEVTVVSPRFDGKIAARDITDAIRADTYLVCVSHSSNVTGQSQNVGEIGRALKEYGVIFLVDCAQSAGYLPIDMTADCIDFAALPAHKGLHGIQGAGALAFNGKTIPKPVVFGGTGTESNLLLQPSTVPDGLEAGTLPCPAILAMSAAITWWADNWQENLKIIAERQSLIAEGLAAIPGVSVYSRQNNSGITAFNISSVDSAVVADALNERYDIAVRAGLHCAPLMHKWLNTFDTGAVRASVSCKTTKEECYLFLSAAEKLAKEFR